MRYNDLMFKVHEQELKLMRARVKIKSNQPLSEEEKSLINSSMLNTSKMKRIFNEK